MPRGAVAENSIFLQHGTQAGDKYLSAGTLPATCPSIKEIISSSYYNKDFFLKSAPLMRSNDFLLHPHNHTWGEWSVIPPPTPQRPTTPYFSILTY